MRKFIVSWEGQQYGSNGSEEFEVEDDATQEEIEEEAREIALQHFSWGHSEVAATEIEVLSVKQSPLNPKQWNLSMACGHDIWVTSSRKPSRKAAWCHNCLAGKQEE